MNKKYIKIFLLISFLLIFGFSSYLHINTIHGIKKELVNTGVDTLCSIRYLKEGEAGIKSCFEKNKYGEKNLGSIGTIIRGCYNDMFKGENVLKKYFISPNKEKIGKFVGCLNVFIQATELQSMGGGIQKDVEGTK